MTVPRTSKTTNQPNKQSTERATEPSDRPTKRPTNRPTDRPILPRQIINTSNTSVLSNVATSNAQYGGRTPDVDRILYVNGADDPWSSQSILESSTVHDLPAIVVEGASHHPWTHPPLDSDQQSVKDARVAVMAQVSAWLALP